jgi:hypothetical protein
MAGAAPVTRRRRFGLLSTLVILPNLLLLFSGSKVLLRSAETTMWLAEGDLLVAQSEDVSGYAFKEPIAIARCTYWTGLMVKTYEIPKPPPPEPLCPGPVL